AVPFVRAAHAFTSKLLEYKLTSFDEFDKALSGRGDCSYFSNFTYSNFLYLVEKFNRDDLKDKVRLAAGHIIDDKGKLEGVHAWLQVLHNGKWVNYETTIDNLRDDDELDFNHLDIMVWPFALSSSTDGTYHFSYVKHEKGKLQTYTNISASLDSDVTFWDWIKLHAKLAMEKDD
ncbi:MAG: hypothetical protein KKA79_00485, partial [Nanoarchaeota archaeon]|nr:hypothetical protein [Nanoarchaeota archaeon]